MNIRIDRRAIAAILLVLAGSAAEGVRAESGATLSMEGAIARALEKNDLVRARAHASQKAGWERRQAWGRLLPTVELSTRMTRIDDRTFAERDFRRYLGPELAEQIPQTVFQTSYATSLDLTMPLFNAALLNGISLAQAGEELARRADRATREGLVSQTIGSYLGVLKARELLGLQREYLELTRLNFERAERLQRANRYAPVETLRWKVEYQQQRSAVVGARAALRTAKAGLERLIGGEAGEEIRVDGEIPEALLAETEHLAGLAEAELLALAAIDDGNLVAQNAGLAVEKAGEEVSRLGHRQARTAYLPSLSLTYSHAWRENDTPALDDYSPKRLMLFLDVPLFNGLQDFAADRAAYHEYMQSRDELADQVQQTRFALGEVVSRIVDLKTQRELARANVELSEEAYRIVERQKEQGKVSNIDFIDAKLNVQNARLGEVTAHFDLIAAVAELHYLLGDLEPLWKDGE